MADQPLNSTELLMLESWVVDNPGSRQFLRLAQAYVERDREDEAAEVLERGLVMNPELLQARWMLGRVLERLGDPQAAVRQLESAARQVTRQAGLFSDLARLMRKMGRESEARQALDIAEALGARTPTEAPPVPLPQLEGPVAGQATPPEQLAADRPEPAGQTAPRVTAAAPPAREQEGEWDESGPAQAPADALEDDAWAEPEDAVPLKAASAPEPGPSPQMRLSARLGSWERAAARRAGKPEPG